MYSLGSVETLHCLNKLEKHSDLLKPTFDPTRVGTIHFLQAQSGGHQRLCFALELYRSSS